MQLAQPSLEDVFIELRAALVPDVPHISVWICLLVLTGSLVLFSWIGMHGFDRRAID